MERIYCAGPSITQKEIDYVTDAVTNCWYGKAGDYHQRFEQAAAEYLGVKHAVSVPTGTSAIHLSLLALGIGEGDEVIVPELTWIGSSAPINYVGARPVFADIDPNTFCLAAESFEACISPKTRAVIAVDLYGGLPDFERIRQIADRHKIAIIEDAAQAFGTRRQGKMAGSFGTTGIFSFHGSKTATTGEGGLFVTDCEDMHDRALTLRDHGRQLTSDRFHQGVDQYYYHFEIGNKFKMSSMQAALGLAQIERAEELVARKREIFDWYEEDLSDVGEICLHREAAGIRSSYWMPAVTIDSSLGIRKEWICEQLEGRYNIDTRPIFYPLSSQPAYADTEASRNACGRNVAAYRVSPFGINLPSSLAMTRQQVARVSEALRVVLREGLEHSSDPGRLPNIV